MLWKVVHSLNQFGKNAIILKWDLKGNIFVLVLHLAIAAAFAIHTRL